MSLKKLLAINQAKAVTFNEDAIKSVSSARETTLITIILSILFVIGFIPFLNRAIVKPIKHLEVTKLATLILHSIL